MVPETMTLANVVVRTLLLSRLLQWDITMSHGIGVDNCSLQCCQKWRPFDPGESRSPTLIFAWNWLATSPEF